MNSAGIPDIRSLMEATVQLLKQGVTNSDRMRDQLAKPFKLDPRDQDWRRFVNNHSFALVRLQTQQRIRKIAPGLYELRVGVPDATPPIHDGQPLPRWARVQISNARRKNVVRWNAEPFAGDDLIALWKDARGRCMLSGLPFRETPVGTGKARRPYAPSLDRIDAKLPYSRRNCRLVIV